MTNNQGKISTKGLIIIVSLFFVSFLLLLFGIYLSCTNNKTKIIEETTNSISDSIISIFDKDEKFYLDNNFTIESSINSYVKLDETNKELIDYIEFLNNISKIKTNIKITQNEEESKLLYTINSKKDNNNYINIKYFIKDSTGYYYNDYITNKYINVGNNNYFESINKNTTTRDNINYIKKIVLESLNNNIAKEYSKQTRENTSYNNTVLKANVVEIELDNRKINNLYKDIIEDLRKDKKSLFILNNIIEGFKDKNIKNKKFLNKKEKIIIKIYTKGLSNEFIKLNVKFKSDNNEKIISYEKINNTKSYLYLITNNKIEYRLDITKTNESNYNIEILNMSKKNIGSITLNKTKKEIILDFSVNENNKRININYRVNYKTIKEKIYNEDLRLDIKYLVNNKNILTLSSEIENKITKENKIREETLDSILEKKLTEEQNIKKEQFISNKLKDLLGGLYETK